MKIKKNVLFAISIFLFFALAAFAAPPAPEKKAAKENVVEQVVKMPLKVIEPIVGGGAKDKAQEKAKEKEVKEPTKEDFLLRLKMMLEHEDEIIGFVPGLKKEKDAQGVVSYTYKGARVEDLNDKDLRTLYAKVQNELNRIRMERLNKQLEAIRQAEQSRRAAEQASKAPRVMTPPPQPPRTPPQPPSTPKPPPAPPQPPRQR